MGEARHGSAAVVHLRDVRVRVDRAVAAALSDDELRRRIVAGLPSALGASLAEATGTELVHAVRRATREVR